MATTGTQLALHSDDVSLVLDASDGRLPEVVHWGAALGHLYADDLAALVLAGTAPIAPNSPDAPVRVSLVPEGRTGWQGRPGLTGSRDGRDWSPDWRLTSITVDGEPAPERANLGPCAVVYRAEDAGALLALTLEVELLQGGLVRTRASVTNTGDEPYRVDELLVAFPVPMRAREVLDFAGRWSKERVPQRTPLRVGTHRREARHGRTGADSAYLLHLGTPGFGFADGEVWAVHTAWSGNHVHYAERLSSGDQVIGGGELLLPGEGTLHAGESYAAPWVYANYGIGLDAVAHRFHRWLRSRPGHPASDRPVTLNVWEAVYFDHRLDRLTALAEAAASVGVERFVLDDGWFGSRRDDTSGLGDWVVSPDVWPDGLHPLIARVNELGMQFGLWVEPEMVNLDSEVARAHPEWVMQPSGRLPLESRHQQVLNLGIPEAYAHVRDQLLSLLAEYPIAYLKWDHNRDLIDAGTAPGGAPGVHRQTLAFYRLVDELKAAHHGLEIESCSSGGARIDLEVMARCDRVWVSDCIDPLERQSMLRWTTQLLPPELLGSHIASGRSHTTGRQHDLSFRAATAVWGHLGIEWDLTQASPAETEELTGWVDWYKANRGLLLGGELVRVDVPDAGLLVHGVVTNERALYEVCATELPSVTNVGRLVLPGLDADARYRVRMLRMPLLPPPAVAPWAWAADGVVLTGRALASVGVRASYLPPEQSFLIEATRV
jgi:alpha-galactosidase